MLGVIRGKYRSGPVPFRVTRFWAPAGIGPGQRTKAARQRKKSVLSFQQSLAILLAGHAMFALAPAMAQAPAPVSVPVDGQRPTAQPVQPQGHLIAPMVQSLKVIVLQGQHSVNDTNHHIGVQPVIEVRDDNDLPVEGASVVFRLPPSGPGGMFDS